MSAERDGLTPDQEEVYLDYLAVTDARDEAELLAMEAEGQPVSDEWKRRRQEVHEAMERLGLSDQVAERQAER